MNPENKKIVFISHNAFGYECLEEILQQGGNVVLVITRKYDPSVSDYCDKFSGLCKKEGITLRETDDVNDKDLKAELRSMSPDYICVFGWSQIIDKEVLSIPKYGCLGTHPSILPKNRGSAAIPWQILNDERMSAVTLFYLEEGLDCGDIVAQEPFELDPKETAETLYQKVIDAGRRLVGKNLKAILLGEAGRVPQNHLFATYLGKRTEVDGLIEWSLDSKYINRLIRAVGKPYPGAYTYYNRKKVIILEAETSDLDNYCGTIGSILDKTDAGVLVQTGRGILLVKRIHVVGEGDFPAANYLKVRRKLGINNTDEILHLLDEVDRLKKDIEYLKGTSEARK